MTGCRLTSRASSYGFFKGSMPMRTVALVVLVCVAGFLFASSEQTQPAATQSPFRFQEVMVRMRDGVNLQTVVLTPANLSKPLPILLRRTPYGVPEKAPEQISPSLKELMQDGYILVIQNLRGRFKSEGYFKLSSEVNLTDPQATNETTDAYDSIE